MAKFNRGKAVVAVRSPIATEQTPSLTTHEGAAGYARRDVKAELFLIAASNMVGEDTFYEKGSDRDARFVGLVRQVALDDPEWMLAFLRWLRAEGNMRSAPLVAAAEAVKARLDVGANGNVTNRSMVNAVLQRPDEPGEMLAYWVSRHGRRIPKPIKRGVADAVRWLYHERSLLKYDTALHGFRFADVLDLVHPSPSAPWQGGLFKHALDRRHGHGEELPDALTIVRNNAQLRRVAPGAARGDAVRAQPARGRHDVGGRTVPGRVESGQGQAMVRAHPVDGLHGSIAEPSEL
jgi:hypothetical protein